MDNSGSFGGALYLDAALFKAPSSLPTAKIEDSMFIANNAFDTSDALGRGGTIY